MLRVVTSDNFQLCREHNFQSRPGVLYGGVLVDDIFSSHMFFLSFHIKKDGSLHTKLFLRRGVPKKCLFSKHPFSQQGGERGRKSRRADLLVG